MGIVPVKYLIEDESLYKDVLKLEQHIFLIKFIIILLKYIEF